MATFTNSAIRKSNMSFENKKVVITGASPDFGQTLAILFAQMGAELILSARTLDKVWTTAALVKQVVPFAKVTCFQMNVSRPDDIIEFASDVQQVTDSIDILINNAAYWLDGQLSDASDEQILEAFNSTAIGSTLVTKHLLPLLKQSDEPDVVFINSTASLPGNRHSHCNEAFSAAKAAQSTLADRLRNRLSDTGIRFITVYPPDFDNPSPLSDQDWNKVRQIDSGAMSARNVFNAINFALEQDRICSVDKIIMSNNRPETVLSAGI